MGSAGASAGHALDPRFVSSADRFEGYTVVEYLGVVRGITVRSRSVVGNFIAGIQTWFGGKIEAYQQLCEQTRAESFEMMLQHAEEIGANAILAFRYDANDVAPGVTEVLAYGTAVRVTLDPRESRPLAE
jgi:uncharacterized protein YbjQ (UPF0145 family)